MLSHPISLIPSSNLTIQFTLRIVSNVNPILMPFFESLEPGFKIYVGNFLIFDYFLDAPLEDEVSFMLFRPLSVVLLRMDTHLDNIRVMCRYIYIGQTV